MRTRDVLFCVLTKQCENDIDSKVTDGKGNTGRNEERVSTPLLDQKTQVLKTLILSLSASHDGHSIAAKESWSPCDINDIK